MGKHYQEAVFEKSKTKGPQRLLLTILAFHANDETGLCFPGHDVLAQETNMGKSTVKRVLTQLKETGEVLVSNKRGRGRGNRYIITLGLSEAEVWAMVDDYKKKSITFETLYWQKRLKKVSEPGHYNEESVSILEGKCPESETLKPKSVSVLNEKSLRTEPSMLTKTNLNTNTTTSTPPAENFDDGSDLGFPPPDPIFAELCQYYAKHCSPSQTITKHVADKIKTELDDQTPKEWLGYALEVAADNEAHRWSFIQAVLDQIRSAGSLNEHITRRKNGQTRTGRSQPRVNGNSQKGRYHTGGIPSLEKNSRYEKRANIATGETYWYDSETGERYSEPPPGMS